MIRRILGKKLLKNFLHSGERNSLYFWRDTAGHEIDILVDLGEELVPLEIKSGQTMASDFFKNLKYWLKLIKRENCPAGLVYGGDKAFKRSGVAVYPWFML